MKPKIEILVFLLNIILVLYGLGHIESFGSNRINALPYAVVFAVSWYLCNKTIAKWLEKK